MVSLVIYFSVFSFGTIFLSQAVDKKSNFNAISLIGLLIIILFGAGRDNVGTDIVTYTHIFDRLLQSNWSSVIDIKDGFLFLIIAKFTYTLGGRVLTWGIFASLTAIPVYLALKNEYSNASFAVAYFMFLCAYYTTSFNISRQMIAVAILFYGVKYVTNNRPVKFILIVAIATGFHASALLALPIWFLWNHKKDVPVRGYSRFFLLVIIALVVLFFQYLIMRLSSEISLFSDYDGYALSKKVGLNRDFYVYLFELVIILLFRRKLIDIDERNDLFISLLIIAVLIGITGFAHPQVKRVAYYYSMPARLVLFAYFPYCFSGRNAKVIKFFEVMWIASLFVTTAYILGQSNLIPYRFDLFS